MSDQCSVTLDDTIYRLAHGENLLSGLTAQGAIVAHSCLAGVCGSCCLYAGPQQSPLLACQHTVTHDLSLSSKRLDHYDVATQQVSMTYLTAQWSLVSAHASVSLPIGAAVYWQSGAHTGQSICCSKDSNTLDFYVPSEHVLNVNTLRLANRPQRARLDPLASFLLLHSGDNAVLAEHFASILTAQAIGSKVQRHAVDLSTSSAQLSFKRFDMAIVLMDTPLPRHELQDWLLASRCRVDEFTYLINHGT